jgi:hypothetical protein
MSIHRRAARRDGNERAIIDALLDVGATVDQLSGKGLPDLLVGYYDKQTGYGKNFLLEVKGEKGKLTEDEYHWHRNWIGQVDVVRTPEEALKVIGAIE